MQKNRAWRWMAVTAVGAVVAAFLPLVSLGSSTAAPGSPAVIDQTGGWPNAPYDSQYGTVNIGYRCNLEADGLFRMFSVDTQVALTALFPLTAAPNEPFYVTDGRGTAVIPAKFVNLLRSYGIRSVHGTSTRFDLTADGATPPVINGSPDLPIPKTLLVKDKPISLTIPYDHQLSIGPYKAPGGVVDIGIGTIESTLHATMVGGIPLIIPIKLSCPALKPKNLVALIPIGGPPNPTPIDIKGHIQAGVVPVNSGLLGAVIPTPCQFPGYGTYTLATNVNAFVKQLFVHSGQQWQFLNGHGYVSLPKELVNAFLAKNPTVTHGQVTLSELQTIATNVNPPVQNYLKGGVPGDPLPLVKDQTAFGSFPANGAMLPPETSYGGQPGVMHVFLGQIQGTVDFRDAADKSVGTPVTFTCPTLNPKMPLLPYVVAPN
jgi:hypothetical protein